LSADKILSRPQFWRELGLGSFSLNLGAQLGAQILWAS
jgi:hypothetical protein